MVPRPVLLVPGWSNRARALRRLARYLLAHGWPRDRVRALEFRDPFGSNIIHAREIAFAVEAMLSVTGADAVDVVAHSMGGLATRRYLCDHEAAPVRRVVFLATPHRGTWAALFAFGGGRREMLPGSLFLRELERTSLPARVDGIVVSTPFDLRVLPRQNALLEGCAHRQVGFVSHQGLLRSRRVHCLVRETLLAS